MLIIINKIKQKYNILQNKIFKSLNQKSLKKKIKNLLNKHLNNINIKIKLNDDVFYIFSKIQ